MSPLLLGVGAALGWGVGDYAGALSSRRIGVLWTSLGMQVIGTLLYAVALAHYTLQLSHVRSLLLVLKYDFPLLFRFLVLPAQLKLAQQLHVAVVSDVDYFRSQVNLALIFLHAPNDVHFAADSDVVVH